jgi:hypothetical protein
MTYTRGSEFTISYLPSLIYIRNYAAVLALRSFWGSLRVGPPDSKRPPVWPRTRPEEGKTVVTSLKNLFYPVLEDTAPHLLQSSAIFSGFGDTILISVEFSVLSSDVQRVAEGFRCDDEEDERRKTAESALPTRRFHCSCLVGATGFEPATT